MILDSVSKAYSPDEEAAGSAPVLGNAGIGAVHGIGQHAQDPVHVQAEHRTDDQRQVADAHARLPAVGVEVGHAEAEREGPDDGDGDVETGQAVHEGGPAVVAPGLGEVAVHARQR